MGYNSVVIAKKGWAQILTEIDHTDGTDEIEIFTAPAEGAEIKSVVITSDDSAAKILGLGINDGSTTFPEGQIQVAAEAGTKSDASVPSVNGLDIAGLEKDLAGNNIIKIGGGLKFVAKLVAGLTTDKKMKIITTYDKISE